RVFLWGPRPCGRTEENALQPPLMVNRTAAAAQSARNHLVGGSAEQANFAERPRFAALFYKRPDFQGMALRADILTRASEPAGQLGIRHGSEQLDFSCGPATGPGG